MPLDHPIRIALVITELEVGGAERCLTNLACGLDQAKFLPEVYSLAPRPAAGEDELVQRLERAGVPAHFVGVRSSWQFLTGLRRLGKLLRQQRPQIVQTFLFHANVLGTLAARGLKSCRIMHGMRVADPSRHRLRMERWLSRRAERLVCVSRSVAEHYRAAGVAADRLAVIPNGIDVRRYPSKPCDLKAFGVPSHRRMLVYVGRLHPQKGLDWLLRLSPGLLHRLPEHDLLLVGDGPQRDALQRRASELGIADRVHFAGWQPNVPEILAAASVCILPSRWEGMPNVLLEAMATGMPFVSTQADGVLELAGDFANAQTSPLGDSSAFVERVVAVATDPTLAQTLGQSNRQRVNDEFSLAKMIASYEQLYGN